ncbi:MAG TPA: hydantoinase B/oxoprolinase family protein [Pyrinomonadaceae bacterium]|nr:hydantoinase B/oxoprolinase family protein [Pyrinomonadaceae bacterium]
MAVVMKSQRDLSDLIALSVMSHKLDSVAQEMGVTMRKSSHSPIFAEANDFACSVTDWNGEQIAQLAGIPIIGAAGGFGPQEVMKDFRKDQIEEGDIFLMNDAYRLGNHLPEMTVVVPVYIRDELLFFTVARAHHHDVGGPTPGSLNARHTSIYAEGIRIPPVKLFENGKLNTGLMDVIKLNVRDPEVLWSDLMAEIGACNVGKKRLIEAMEKKYTNDEIRKVVEGVLASAERQCRDEISTLPNGKYYGEFGMDNDGINDQPIMFRVTITVEDEDITVDYTGTDPQAEGSKNCTMATTYSGTHVAVLWALSGVLPRNSGSFRPIKIIAPEGTLVNPRHPAAVGMCTLPPACAMMGAALKAFGEAAPERVPAGFFSVFTAGYGGIDPRTEKLFIGWCFGALGGGGGYPHRDGDSFVAPISNYNGILVPNIETDEINFPIKTLRHEYIPNTGGAGKFRGGNGVDYTIEFRGVNPDVSVFGDGAVIPAYGLNGGMNGSLNEGYLNRGRKNEKRLSSNEGWNRAKSGDTITVLSAGGGGWGNALDRDPIAVMDDVRNEMLSVEKAREWYGVVISGEDVDRAATEKLRAGMQAARTKA